ncbi:MAG TPA: MFS transporter, partial [Petrotogaceae bacterium]|nr:MFS transporter [Petrotogaceae bacterium]
MNGLRLLFMLPFMSIFVQVGFSSAFSQLSHIYSSSVAASTFIGITPLTGVFLGFLWAGMLKRYGERRTFLTALTGWSVSIFFIGIFLDNIFAAIIFRAVQGVFEPALYSTALTGVSKSNLSMNEKVKSYGIIELMGSLGAIAGPSIIGNSFLLDPKPVIIGFSLFCILLCFFGFKRIDTMKADREKHEKTTFSFEIFKAVFFGLAVLLSIVAIQVALPSFVEDRLSNPFLGKIMVSAFSLFLMIGNLVKHRIKGINSWMILFAALFLFFAYMAIDIPVLFVIFLNIAGFFLGINMT